MKRTILLLGFILSFWLISKSQISQKDNSSDFEILLSIADSLYSSGDFVNAYQTYSILWDTEEFPDADLGVLSKKLQKVRISMDNLKLTLKNYIKQSEHVLRRMEESILLKVVADQKREFKKKEKFDPSMHITRLDLSNYGIVQIPEIIIKYKNLRKINLKDNPNLDTAQVFKVLRQCHKLRETVLDNSRANNLDTVSIKLQTLAHQFEQECSKYIEHNPKQDTLILYALNFYRDGRYSSSLLMFQILNDNFDRKIDFQLDKLEGIVLQTIELTIVQLQEEMIRAEKNKQKAELAILARASGIVSLSDTTGLSNITSLDFEGFNMRRLPIGIQKIENLSSINLIGNSIENWDTTFQLLSSFESLENIYISASELDSISKKYRQLITGLDIDTDNLSQVPQSVLQQAQLIWLDISGGIDFQRRNKLSNPITKIAKLKDLHYLNLRNCEIHVLSKDIGKLSNLRQLNLAKNKLKDLPSEIGELTYLKNLNLEHNIIKVLPVSIGNLKSLDSLDLSFNNLESIPPEIADLKNLTYLNLSHNNKLTKLPPEISELTNLRELNLFSTPLKKLPSNIDQLINLKILILGYNDFSETQRKKNRESLPNCLIKYKSK